MGAEWVVAAAGRASRAIAAAGRVDLQEKQRRPQTGDLAPVYAEFRTSSKSAAAVGIIAIFLDRRRCICTV